MRQHPASSEMILEELNGFEEIAIWIARHHERPDGKGYPEMLTGDDIPLESRILAVADVFAALTSERPHRGAVSRKDARQILLGAAGTQLDAEARPPLLHADLAAGASRARRRLLRCTAERSRFA